MSPRRRSGSPAPRSTAWTAILAITALCASSTPACHRTPAPCRPLCTTAERLVEACLDDWGQDWGDSFGYSDPDDYLNWCETYLDELAELAHARWPIDEAWLRMADTCEAQMTVLEQGLESEDCGGYGESWEKWEEFVEGG